MATTVRDEYTILVCPKCGKHEQIAHNDIANCMHDGYVTYRKVPIRVVPALTVPKAKS